ncbi:MAG: hypothetical protein JNM00_04485 [Flavobacteriales bacterium]|nr:hypothetical protein [Flavobacteriales bacterium]
MKPFKHLFPAAALFFAVSLVFVSCKPDEETEEINLGYDYFPVDIGKYITYEVDSIGYGLTGDTANYLIKEITVEQILDATGEVAIKVERYRSDNNGTSWYLADVWTKKRTATSAQKVEEDVRYVRLVFPLEVGKSWNGNAYNTMDAWNYVYEDIDVPRSFGLLSFDQTLEVNQRNNMNLVDQEVASEIYARGVGLVYKRLTDLNVQSGEITGIDMEMTIVDYGDFVE